MKFITGEYPEIITVCGIALKAIGTGKYPYDCISKDKYPKAMIYKSVSGSWDCLQTKQKRAE